MFACFDQPDLKADVHLSVDRARRTGRPASNGRASSDVEQLDAGKRVHFATTARISPYITALVAGPYHVVTDHHDGIDLGLWCRKTLAEHLDADELFTITKQGFDWYHANFGMRYAFDKYDQLFVPEFNAGAMENAGCVTFREDYVFRSKVTERPLRAPRRDDPARDGAHVVRRPRHHALVGRPVAQRVVRDLRLGAVPDQRHPVHRRWATFANAEKTWAYRQDQLPSTHPIATDAPDVQTAEVNFDGITYAKGASVLKQLGAYVGVEAFLAGLREYFSRPRLRQHDAGRPAAGARALVRARPRRVVEALARDRRHQHAAPGVRGRRRRPLHRRSTSCRRAPDEVAVSNTLRPHRLAVGLYERAGRRAWCARDRVELDVTGARTPVPELIGARAAGAAAGQRRRPDLLQAAAGRAQPRHPARRRHRPARVAAGPGAVLVGGVGHDPRRRARRPATTSPSSSPAPRTRPTSASCSR